MEDNFYELRLRLGDVELMRSYGNGRNAFEAAERAVEEGALHLPPGDIYEVEAINQATGVTLFFKAARAG